MNWVCLPPLLAYLRADLGGDRFGHFGLGLSHYTHFTSPIRRYADVVVHRLLLASLQIESMKVSLRVVLTSKHHTCHT